MKTLNNPKGQSTIEFLVTFGFTLLIVFVLLKISLNITNGFLVHYGTYAASRAFLVSDEFTIDYGDAKAGDKANQVFKSIVKGSSVTVTPQPIDVATQSVFVGVRAQFTQNLAFSNVVGGKKPLTFISESYIGRSPTMSECVRRTCDAIKQSVTGMDDCLHNVTIDDNGC